jgi:hypothetical protein
MLRESADYHLPSPSLCLHEALQPDFPRIGDKGLVVQVKLKFERKKFSIPF